MKIFVTVGAQIPFDRLVMAMDAWAARHNGEHELFAQIGEKGHPPAYIGHAELVEPLEFRRRVFWADALVAHAGMGSILMALQYGKPILVMPRQGRLRETRNDHQIATARRFMETHGVVVAMDETEIPPQMDRLAAANGGRRISEHASVELIDAIRSFILGRAT